MEFIKVLKTSELPIGAMKRVEVKEKEILVANVAGTFYAMDNQCTHMGGSLASGKLNGSVVTCPKHGAMFDVKTGQPCGDAKMAFIKIKVKPEECYAIKVQGDSILVGVG